MNIQKISQTYIQLKIINLNRMIKFLSHSLAPVIHILDFASSDTIYFWISPVFIPKYRFIFIQIASEVSTLELFLLSFYLSVNILRNILISQVFCLYSNL